MYYLAVPVLQCIILINWFQPPNCYVPPIDERSCFFCGRSLQEPNIVGLQPQRVHLSENVVKCHYIQQLNQSISNTKVHCNLVLMTMTETHKLSIENISVFPHFGQCVSHPQKSYMHLIILKTLKKGSKGRLVLILKLHFKDSGIF